MRRAWGWVCEAFHDLFDWLDGGDEGVDEP